MPRGNNPENVMRSREEAEKNGRKGGIRSGEVRREKARTREIVKMLLNSNIPAIKGAKGAGASEVLTAMGIPVTEQNMCLAILAGQSQSAMNGNHNAARFIFELAGDDPLLDIKEREINLKEKEYESLHSNPESSEKWNGLPAHLIGKAFFDLHRYIRNRKYTTYDLKGGRGSLKSTFIALTIIDEMKHDKTACAVVLRAIKDDISSTVYDQLVWAIDMLDLTDEWKCTKSPLMILNKVTGQRIYFRAADRPSKVKSIRPPKGMAIKLVWFEEFDEVPGMQAYRNVLQSAFRAGVNDGIVFRSYNTPVSASHFVNKDALVNDPARIIHFSNYKDAPREWLGETFYTIAEQLRATNERAYRHEYGGEATGTGANVFENIELRAIPDDEIDKFDKIYCGIDWGAKIDPNVFGAMCYDSKRQILYVFREVVYHGMNNKAFADKIGSSWKNTKITADNQEPKSIKDFSDWGFYIRPAKKGPGSIAHGIKWLASRFKIVIDSVRCPLAASEFTGYEQLKTKDGEIISDYPDKNNHFIDLARYASEDIWREERWK